VTQPPLALPAGQAQGGDKDAGGDDTKFDAFLGNDAGVLGATGVYDEEDREADHVWDNVEDRMDERRKVWAGVQGLAGWAL
jgi:pre-mRNA-processing factor 6